jgi:hypothetical protein
MQQGFQYALPDLMPLAVATGLFRSLATFYVPVQTQGPTGNWIGTTTALYGMTNIPCMDSPVSSGRLMATEDRTSPVILAESYRHVLLDGWYPLASNAAAGSGWQVDIDGTLYDLLGAESDSQQTQTRLHLQRVTVATP